MVAYRDLQSLDLTGPLEVFAAAEQILERRRRGGRQGTTSAGGAAAGGAAAGSVEVRSVETAGGAAGYRITVASMDGAPLRTSSGLQLVPACRLEDAAETIDTLIVPGGKGSAAASGDEGLVSWLAENGPRARRVASVCTGAFVLAAAGLLDGRRVTTHWASAQRLAERYPRVLVDPEPIYLRDGRIWTSAGVTAGMDLALALVEEDLDREAALTIARHLVLFLRRPGNQSQFSATLAAQRAEREPLREVQRFVVENPREDLSVEALAERAHMSGRNFARAFRSETGITPGRYVERVRLEAARRALEDTRLPVARVAAECGFASGERMRRCFLRALGVGPAEYRRRYQPRTYDHERAA
ncbi:MAG TPA: GlxA family transcriptional regulator [Solirubrobacteraceae bacterium]|nr:GlxA family transcriptional regulator [Solirubrobacteraceae bacterium]